MAAAAILKVVRVLPVPLAFCLACCFQAEFQISSKSVNICMSYWRFCLLWKVPTLSTPQKWGFLGSYIPNFQNWLMRPPKGTSLGGTTLFELSTIKIGSAVWAVALSRNYKKKEEKNRNLHDFGVSVLRPPRTDRNQCLQRGSDSGWDDTCQFWWLSVHRFRSCAGCKFRTSPLKRTWPITTCLALPCRQWFCTTNCVCWSTSFEF
jgi:hypothetical protein